MVHVILVDMADNEIGTMEKMEAHQKGVLHRAVSVVLFNSKGEMLLQKRAPEKYHSGGLWSNTCCSHPLPGETMEHAALRTLRFEMGIELQPSFAYSFLYHAHLGANLTEHEFDHVFTANYDAEPVINTDEVADWKWASLPSLRDDIAANPDDYSCWFRLMLAHPEMKNRA